VDLYRHDTGAPTPHRWTLAGLVAAIEARRPRGQGDPEWTFCVGQGRRDIAISTTGPASFCGQPGV